MQNNLLDKCLPDQLTLIIQINTQLAKPNQPMDSTSLYERRLRMKDKKCLQVKKK